VRTMGVAAVLLAAAIAVPVSAQDAARPDRYQISQLERMLEGAVEHGAAVVSDRLQGALPGLLISENARARGFRLDGYGVFFDVAVPSLQSTMPWIFRTLDRNDLGLATALAALRAHVDADGDESLRQALLRIELQVAPVVATAAPASAPAGSRGQSGSAATVSAQSLPPATDQLLEDPREAFHTEVRQQVVDALLDFASALGIGPDEWVTVALRPDEDTPLVAPAADDGFTMTIRVRGRDLAAFRGGQLTQAQARQRVEVRLF
jgi:hypothetical protein